MGQSVWMTDERSASRGASEPHLTARTAGLVIAVTAGVTLGGWLAGAAFAYCGYPCRDNGFWTSGRVLFALGGSAVLGSIIVVALWLSRRAVDGTPRVYVIALVNAVALTGLGMFASLLLLPVLWGVCGWVLFATAAGARRRSTPQP